MIDYPDETWGSKVARENRVRIQKLTPIEIRELFFNEPIPEHLRANLTAKPIVLSYYETKFPQDFTRSSRISCDAVSGNLCRFTPSGIRTLLRPMRFKGL